MTDDFGPVPPELEAAADRAAELIRRPEAIEAFNEAAGDDCLWREASEDPRGFLESRGLKLPEELGAKFVKDFSRQEFGRPVPEFEFFTIRLTRCRKYWLKKRDGVGYEQVEVCLGFEFVPNPIPGGPFG